MASIDDITNKLNKVSISEPEPVFTEKQIAHYTNQKDKCFFKNPRDEFLWAKKQNKTCSKCEKVKALTEFTLNTSGSDAFDKNGYIRRRPECSECTKLVSKGNSEAKKAAKKLGISYTAPEGTLCEVCNKQSAKGNALVFDHSHDYKVFRGYCHNSCNRSIGVLGDNVDGLLKALNYLLKSEKCTVEYKDGKFSKIN
jgi:hypothetical protein